MQIGQLAASTGTTTKTIRYYESIGLLAEPRRLPSGYREYDDAAVDRLRFIRESQSSGLSLAEIQSILELKDAGATSCEHTATLLRRHLEELDEQIERLQRSRIELADMADRAAGLDPVDCTDPNRCQVVAPT
jgi:DNA-binding transcriptional MerR regulator